MRQEHAMEIAGLETRLGEVRAFLGSPRGSEVSSRARVDYGDV
jgi:hypothetical protein